MNGSTTDRLLQEADYQARRRRLLFVLAVAFGVVWIIMPAVLYVLRQFFLPGTPMFGLLVLTLAPCVVFLGLFVISWLREFRRPPPGLCRNCRDDLRGNVSGICPECGRATPACRVD